VDQSGGLDYSKDYAAYTAKREKCAASSVTQPPQAGLSGYKFLAPNDEAGMLEALAYGPIGVQVLVDE
jgi:hypothetical protein